MTSLRIALLLATLAVVRAAPAPAPAPAPVNDNTPEIIEIIAPAASAQETLDSLNLGDPGSELSERNKRTIGILRQLFPTLTQIVEQKIQNLTSQLFNTFGPIILNAISGSRGNRGSDGSIVDTFDDEEEDSDIEEVTSAAPVKFASDAEAVPNVKMISVQEPIENLTELNSAGTQRESAELMSSATEIKVPIVRKYDNDEKNKTETSSENSVAASSESSLTTEKQDTTITTTKTSESEKTSQPTINKLANLEEDSDNETTKRKRTIASN